jgi:hypothetical protein
MNVALAWELTTDLLDFGYFLNALPPSRSGAHNNKILGKKYD